MSLLLLLLQLQAKRTDPCQHKVLDLPIVSFVVPFFAQPTVYAGSSKATNKGTTVTIVGISHMMLPSINIV